jgi:hypothetical protein
MKPFIVVSVIISFLLVIIFGVYNYYSFIGTDNSTSIKEKKYIPVELQECSRVPGQIKKCPEGYFCYESISGGLGPDGPLPIEHVGGDNKCYKVCSKDSDCTIETPYCVLKKFQTEDMLESIHFCFEKDCASQGEQYYNNSKPNHCCDGLTDVYTPADGYISVADKCYFTDNMGFIKGGYCSDCGNGICEHDESICGCPDDCNGKGRSEYKTVQEFCNGYWNTYETIRTRCEKWDSFKNNPICKLCQ